MAPTKRVSKATKLKNLNRRRANILHSAELIRTFDADYVMTQANQLPIRIQHLDELWKEFNGVQDQIEELEDTGDTEQNFSEERSTFQTMYYTLKDSLYSKMTAPSAPSTSSNRLPPTPLAQTVPNLRLPEIKLKEFSGQFEEWESFSDLFVSLIHSNYQLTHVQKLYY